MRNKLSFILILFLALFCLPPLAPPWSQAQDKKRDGKPPPSRKAYELRLAHLKNEQAICIRFNAETGESWIAETKEIKEVNWVKSKDSKRLPEGNYDVVLAVNKEGEIFTALRIDRATGTTWITGTIWWIVDEQKEIRWKEITEPE